MIFTAIFLGILEQPTKGPINFGLEEVRSALGSRAGDVSVSVKHSGKKESYRIEVTGGKVSVIGSDSVGAMYGAFDLAERARKEGVESAMRKETGGEPYLPDRGLNLFLTLPWNYTKNDTDYDVAALTDPNRWWFHNERYWTSLLDLMAHSRLNWLDIHGAWDISVTNAPNLYAYFVSSKSFPRVGVSDTVKRTNLRQLNHVIEMAHQRGIRVSLMAYEANLKIPQNPNPPYKADEPEIYKYTREVVEQMIRRAPGLDAIGFRIGESGRSESFFKCYGEAVAASGRDIPLITRSWITRKQQVLPLARASHDFTVEIKYNGEQWGAPYMVAGGRVANWYSYSFEDYLSDSGQAGKRMWPGQPAAGGGTWPSEPYKIVWQVRANGTHRIFPFYNPDWVRRSILDMKIGTASGYTIEGEDAYYPKSPDYYEGSRSGRDYEWIHERDRMYWMTWGRLGYDPRTPSSVFDSEAERMLGPSSADLVRDWKAASLLVSKAFMGFSLGPDHRSHAPELEWGGDSGSYIQGQPFDSFSFTPINEELANFATGGIDGRVRLSDLAAHLNAVLASQKTVIDGASAGGLRQDILQGFMGLSNLGAYYAGRFESARQVALGEASGQGSGQDSMPAALDAFRRLAENGFYKPFTERLRMHTNTFAWSQELEKVEAEVKRVALLPKGSTSGLPTDLGNRAKAKLSWTDVRGAVSVHLDAPGAKRAWLLWKPLPSSTFFHRMEMKPGKGGLDATFSRQSYGFSIAAEYDDGSRIIRVPNVMLETPFVRIPAQAGPTPQIYNANEALAYLDPSKISLDKYSEMLIGTRAWAFFSSYGRPDKRKLLEPVRNGMRLLILQQDFAKYKLDWLPKPLRFEGFRSSMFDPGGQLGLEKVETADILWQRFLPSEGWEVFGNGGLARHRYGKGEIWVTSARLMQRMHIPSVARDFVRLLSLGGRTKPTILVDSCSEGADFSSSCHADLMNSHGIPFRTLGEVVAQEQGMGTFQRVAGPVWPDDILEGRGSEIANRFLRNEVIRMSKRPTPASLRDFEKERVRRKKELMRTLGLDPMPPKTPLNARITGVIQRDGYRIEKLVFESRPKFYVTGHVYVPDGPAKRRPVIVNVNGHWAHKKDEDRIQLRCSFQALSGYTAIAIDSPGWSFEGNSLIERRGEGPHNDFALVQGGTNATGYYVWDAIRALDYMATRSDTDMQHIGITGASGGGLATLYTFAADDRYSAAVPVVYMASLELAPDNGCLCNHVPGTCQVGDRSDVISIQAPKPVYLMGAQNDGEFPPDATMLTHKKMQATWALFGKQDQALVQIFEGGHDYNQLMREASIGFFNRYLKESGDGKPVAQPTITAINPEDRSLLALDPPAKDERTMRDLALESLRGGPSTVSREQAMALNGGLPARTELKYSESGAGLVRQIRFESQPGLVTPGLLYLPGGKAKGIRIIVSDAGKAAASEAGPAKDGFAVLYLDVLGTGELSELEMRYPVYLGTSIPFLGGWQIVRSAEALSKVSGRVEIEGRGPISSQSVMWAGLMDSRFSRVMGTDCLASWEDAFRDGFPAAVIQPRASLFGPLDSLQKLVKNGTWRHLKN